MNKGSLQNMKYFSSRLCCGDRSFKNRFQRFLIDMKSFSGGSFLFEIYTLVPFSIQDGLEGHHVHILK